MNQGEEALYLVAVRTKIEPSGNEIIQAIEQALSASIPLRSQDVTIGVVVTLYDALTANHNGYLRKLGFDFHTANRLITVAWNDNNTDDADA